MSFINNCHLDIFEKNGIFWQFWKKWQCSGKFWEKNNFLKYSIRGRRLRFTVIFLDYCYLPWTDQSISGFNNDSVVILMSLHTLSAVAIVSLLVSINFASILHRSIMYILLQRKSFLLPQLINCYLINLDIAYISNSSGRYFQKLMILSNFFGMISNRNSKVDFPDKM